MDRLREMIRIIEEYGSTDKARNLIAEKLNQIAPKENLILKQFAYLKDLSQKIEDFDLRSFKDLRARWDKIPEKEKDIIKRRNSDREKQDNLRGEASTIRVCLSRYDNDFRYSVSSAVECLKSNQPAQARDWLLKAIQCEEEAMNLQRDERTGKPAAEAYQKRIQDP